MLGTYTALCGYTAGPQGGITPDPESMWELPGNESWLKTAKDIAVTLSDGSSSRISSGTELRLTAVNDSCAAYETRDGQRGTFALTYDPEEDIWLADGQKETDAFIGLPYRK